MQVRREFIRTETDVDTTGWARTPSSTGGLNTTGLKRTSCIEVRSPEALARSY